MFGCCPICKAKRDCVLNNKYFPFCSRRCKHIDLRNWFSNKYYICGSVQDKEDDCVNRGRRKQLDKEE
jgi:endogenous inhibitor of DNA gyrase (YacG/DUF329 family)